VSAVAIVLFRRDKIRETFRLKFPTLKQLAITLVVFSSGILVASYLDEWLRLLLEKQFGLVHPEVFKPSGSTSFLTSLAALALLPAISEEIIFRGLILSGYRQYFPARQSIIIGAILFAIAHLSITNFCGPLVLGMIAGWLVTTTGSIFPAMIGHCFNNGLAVVLLYFFGPGMVETAGMDDLLAGAPVFAGACIFLIYFIIKNSKRIDDKPAGNPAGYHKLLKDWPLWLVLLLFISQVALELSWR